MESLALNSDIKELRELIYLFILDGKFMNGHQFAHMYINQVYLVNKKIIRLTRISQMIQIQSSSPTQEKWRIIDYTAALSVQFSVTEKPFREATIQDTTQVERISKVRTQNRT